MKKVCIQTVHIRKIKLNALKKEFNIRLKQFQISQIQIVKINAQDKEYNLR